MYTYYIYCTVGDYISVCIYIYIVLKYEYTISLYKHNNPHLRDDQILLHIDHVLGVRRAQLMEVPYQLGLHQLQEATNSRAFA